MGEFVQPNLKSGRFIDAAGLMSTWRGKKVQLRGGRVRVVDGPFTESKEIVDGYTLVEAASDEEALELARQFVELHPVHRLQARKDVADEPRLVALAQLVANHVELDGTGLRRNVGDGDDHPHGLRA